MEESGDRNRWRSNSELVGRTELSFFLVCLLVIGSMGMWSSGVDPFQALPMPNLRSKPRVLEVDRAAPPKPAQVRMPTPPSKVIQNNDVGSAETRPAEAPVVAIAPVTEVQPPVGRAPEFPIARQIRVGANKLQITEQFGTPSLLTTTHDNGHLVENFVYRKADGADETVIRIEDGKVLAAYSK